MGVQIQTKLTLTRTRGTQLVRLLDLWSELQLVLLKPIQPRHVHQRESHDLEITEYLLQDLSKQMTMKIILKSTSRSVHPKLKAASTHLNAYSS